jgi:hypothetical protein
MHHNVRACLEASFAVAIAWKKLETSDNGSCRDLGDAAALAQNTGFESVAGWSPANQLLPNLR